MSGRAKLQDTLAYPPRGFRADRAAAHLGMSKSKFLELVDAGTLPKPKCIDGMRIWDRLAIEAAFSNLPDSGDDEDEPAGRKNTFDVIVGGR